MKKTATDTAHYDVLVIGGGINGAVSAAALAHKGLKVLLVERGDFASQTSQESSCLVWGGVKYLENWEFSLVWKLCRSRNQLMRSYPSSIREIRFFVPIQKGRKSSITRYKPFIWAGTMLYWIMGRFFTRRPTWYFRKETIRQEPSLDQSRFAGAIEYSDAYLPDGDARFVYRFIHRATDYGADCRNYHECRSLARDEKGNWQAEIRPTASNKSFSISASFVLNCTGPWADANNTQYKIATRHRHELSKGVHLVTERLGQSRRVITIFADDGRMFFVLPMGPRSCLGTTDTRVNNLPAVTDDNDRHFILDQINERFNLQRPLGFGDIIAERCGVRPLVVTKRQNAENDDWTSLSRKHVLEKSDNGFATVFGGKLTDCVNIGDEVTEHITDYLLDNKLIEKPNRTRSPRPWFGEPEMRRRDELFHWFESYLQTHPNPPKRMSLEGQFDLLWRRYQDDIKQMFSFNSVHEDDFEPVLPGSDVIWAELRYIAKFEQVKTVEDMLRRRTLLSLCHDANTIKKSGIAKKLESWIKQQD